MTMCMQKVMLVQKLTRWIPVRNMLQRLWKSGAKSLWHSDCCCFERHPMEDTTAYWPYSDTLVQVMDECKMSDYFGVAIFGICTWIFNFLSWEVFLLYILQTEIHLFEKLGKYWCSCLTVNIVATVSLLLLQLM